MAKSASPFATAIICDLSLPWGFLAKLLTNFFAHFSVASSPIFSINDATKDWLYILLELLITILLFHF